MHDFAAHDVVGQVQEAADQDLEEAVDLDMVEAVVQHAQHEAHDAGSVQAEAKAFATEVIPAQAALRTVVDELETLVADDLWPLPKYRELLFQY